MFPTLPCHLIETESYRWFPDFSQITQPEYFISELNFDAINGGIVIGAA